MQLFYHPDARPDSIIELDENEAAHLVRVLRKKDGEHIDLTDGRGGHYEGEVRIGKKKVEAHLRLVQIRKDSSFGLELAIAPTKNQDRLEWFIEKAVEIGIQKITLLKCEHSERVTIREERLHRVAVAAMKQSLKFYLPAISPIREMKKWMQECTSHQKLIAHCDPEFERQLLKNSMVPRLDAAIAIGPEGDFSKDEIRLALQCGFKGVSLGNSRLRTETAALGAVHTFELLNQVE